MILYETSRLYADGKDLTDGGMDSGVQGWVITTGAVVSGDLKE